jgi:hypothetical protein
MALQLLDGTSAVFDFQTDVNSTDLNAANTVGGAMPAATSANFDSWKCAAGYLSLDITREMLERTTFCTGGWRGRVPALKDLQGRLEGFSSKGAKISDPLYLFATTKGVPTIVTIDTGCTISAEIMASRHHTGVRAAQNSEMGLDFVQDGTYIPPATVWVTS